MSGCKNKKSWKRVLFVILGVGCLAPILSACGVERSVIPDRLYVAEVSSSPVLKNASQSVWKGMTVKVDRASKKVIFTLANKTKVESEYKIADESSWIKGCPGNYSSIYLETLLLKQNLTLGKIVFKVPVLVADCFYKDVKGANSGNEPPGSKGTNLGNVSLIDGMIGLFSCESSNQCVKFRTKSN